MNVPRGTTRQDIRSMASMREWDGLYGYRESWNAGSEDWLADDEYECMCKGEGAPQGPMCCMRRASNTRSG